MQTLLQDIRFGCRTLLRNPGFKMVTPSYAATLGIRLRKGRFLSELDRKGGAPVTVINETMAKRDSSSGLRWILHDLSSRSRYGSTR